MSYFAYSNNLLKSEGIEISKIAKGRSTPFYCYSKNAIAKNYNNFSNSFKNIDVKICFSLKSNSNLSILKILSDLGAGADVVSEGELKKALKANIEASNIVFSGVGKTEGEISFAIKNHCLQINVESLSELDRVNTIAGKIGNTQKVALRINPDVDPNTHGKITTGKIENKLKQEQMSLEYEFKIEQAEKEAQRQIIEAQGKAKSNQILSVISLSIAP